ncbi:ABC transporter ATP-binding protein [Salinibacterium hongtaonis]|nr:ATP-binding cassette domain-containing protein [Salinibacterium hongtaonis]
MNLTFTVEAGQSLAIVGPSGSGKSTLLSIIAGFTDPSSGELRFDGSRGHIEWAPQASPLLSRRTALDNVMLPTLIRGADPGAARMHASKTLDDLGLGAFAHTPVYRLSGGERQRVGVARAVVSRPRMLLADEPTASLDPYSRTAVIQTLRRCTQEGTAVIIATHDPIVAEQCDTRLDLQLDMP